MDTGFSVKAAPCRCRVQTVAVRWIKWVDLRRLVKGGAGILLGSVLSLARSLLMLMCFLHISSSLTLG